MADCTGTIKRIDTSDNSVVDFAGATGATGSLDGVGAAARLNCPYGLTIDSTAENLYFSDWGNNKIRKVHIATQTVTTLAGAGPAGSGDNVDGSLARFNGPNKLALGHDFLFVADWRNCTLRQVNITTTEVSTIAGSAGLCGGSDGFLATATLGALVAVAYDPRFGIFIASGDWRYETVTANSRIRLIH